MSALDNVNVRRVISKINEECTRKLVDGIFDLDAESASDMIKDTCEYYLDKKVIHDYSAVSVISYHSFEFLRKNKRWYLRATTKDQNGDFSIEEDVKVYSKRQAVELWKKYKHCIRADLAIKPVHPCDFIHLKFKIGRS